MSANRIFLVCTHCQELESTLCLAERADADSQYTVSSMKRADDWFAKHARCGRGCDHYTLGYGRTHDWDVSPPAENTAAGGVRLALLNGGES